MCVNGREWGVTGASAEHWDAVLSVSPDDPSVLEPLILALINAEIILRSEVLKMWMAVEPDNIHAALGIRPPSMVSRRSIEPSRSDMPILSI